jgi:hypothetical protein
MSLTKASFSMIKGAVVNAVDYGLTQNSPTTVSNASTVANRAALLAAIAALDNGGDTPLGGTVFIPAGDYYIDPEIEITKRSVIIQGNGGGYGYVPSDTTATRLHFTSGLVGDEMGFNLQGTPGTGTNCDFSGLQNLYIDCQSVLPYGVIVGGAKIFDQVTISFSTFAGIKLTNFINSTVITRCSFSNNDLHGAIMEFVSVNGNTKCSISDTSFLRNGGNGLIINNAVGMEVNNCTIESNLLVGLLITKPTGGDLYNLAFNSCWFEGNSIGSFASPTGGYQIRITAQVPGLGAAAPGPIYFNNCNVNGPPANTAAYGIDLICGTVTYTGGSILMTLGQEVNLGTFALACQFIDVLNTSNYLTSTAGTGTLCSVIYPKITGGTNRAGEISTGGFWTKGGRTQILWFTFTGSIAAGASAITDAVNGTAGVLKTFPLTGQVGSLVGMIIAKKVPVTAGSLTVIPYYTAGWSGATTNYTTAYPLTVGIDNISYTFPFETFTFASGATTNNTSFLGVSLTGNASYNQGTDSDCMVGLIIEI